MTKFLLEFANDTTGLGDLISLMPYVEKFSKIYGYETTLMIKNKNIGKIFEKSYPTIKFIGKDETIEYDKFMSLKHEKFDKPLQNIFAEQLGFINAEYIRPKVDTPNCDRPLKNKYVAFSMHSTYQMKYWNSKGEFKNQLISPNWNELCKFLRKKNLTPVCVDNYENFGVTPYRNFVPTNCVKKLGLSLDKVSEIIYHSEFFIGLSSGLSWLAHALNKKVCMISNFTEDWHEFSLNCEDYIRIINKDVCHGCWNKMNIDFSNENLGWYSCPRHENTSRQFECHTSISSENVIEKISQWIN